MEERALNTEKSDERIGQSRETPEPKTAVLYSALLLGLLIWQLLSVTYSGAINPASGITGMDFQVFYHAAVRLNHGGPLYQPDLDISLQHALYCYTPLPAEMLRPLGHLSFEKALKVWFAVNAAGLILAIGLYGSAARLTWRNVWLLGILLLVSFRFWDNTLNFGIGQSNDFLLAFVGGMLWADSRGRWDLMGALIVIAALFKLWLIGLLLYLLLRRQWKPLVWSIAGFALSLGGSFLLVGWNKLPAFVRVLQESKASQEGQEVQSSILGFANVSLHANPFVTPLVNSQGVYLAFIVLGTAAVLGGFAFLWQVLRRPSPLEARLAFGMTLASILLLLPTYENGYFVYCFPLLWTLLVSPDADQQPFRFSVTPARLMLIGGTLLYLIFSRPWPFFTPFPPAYQHGILSLLVSMKFFGTVALWGLAWLTLVGLRREIAPQSAETAIPANVQVQP